CRQHPVCAVLLSCQERLCLTPLVLPAQIFAALRLCLPHRSPCRSPEPSPASRASATALPDPQVVATARQQIELIPPPAKSRYMAVHSLNGWENPYLTVQANMATLHITLADANPSQIGVGGMLRPVSARRQDV